MGKKYLEDRNYAIHEDVLSIYGMAESNVCALAI